MNKGKFLLTISASGGFACNPFHHGLCPWTLQSHRRYRLWLNPSLSNTFRGLWVLAVFSLTLVALQPPASFPSHSSLSLPFHPTSLLYYCPPPLQFNQVKRSGSTVSSPSREPYTTRILMHCDAKCSTIFTV